ncbi:Processing alpha glucosidase I, partial [Tulasnella sp. 427]
MRKSTAATVFLALVFPSASAFTQISNVTDTDSLIWGTYRPNLYFGMRPRVPKSLMTGIMWFGTQEYGDFQVFRHSCELSDELAGYTWTEHDPREGGVQVLKDPKYNLELTTEVLKFPGGIHGGSWATRIKGKPLDPSKPMKISMIAYQGIEGLGSLELETEADANGLTGEIVFSGESVDLGKFRLRRVESPDSHVLTEGLHANMFKEKKGKTHFMGRMVPDGSLWRAKDIVFKAIMDFVTPQLPYYRNHDMQYPEPGLILTLPNDAPSASNFYALQKTYDGEFSFDVFFDSESAETKLNGETFTRLMQQFKTVFDKRFRGTFPVPASLGEKYVAFSKAVTSNLMGGVGYFYGDSIVDGSVAEDDDGDDDVSEETPDDPIIKARAKRTMAPPRELLTATPSRPFFPRGFYWDEGFHLLQIGAWDNDLSLEILKSWIDLIDENGWVGREQILGEEARSKVPEEFQMQFPTYANPPTLIMAVTAFIDRLKVEGVIEDPLAQFNSQAEAQTGFSDSRPRGAGNQLLDGEAAKEFLRSIYLKLLRHYEWFRRTQRGQIRQWSGRVASSSVEAYRWRGRSKEHVLTSGLDDYPRPEPHVGELHVDLISWMAFYTKTMRGIAEFLGEEEDEAEFARIQKEILDNLDELHWSEEYQMYCDLGVNEEDESIYVCHKGYVSLFPFLLGLIQPTSKQLKPILDLIQDPKHLWSNYGIRSLSASHELFGQGEDYWKGPIWMPMNYLALSALHKKYAAEDGPHQAQAKQVYDQLRKNVIENVYKEYERTGYVWEQYDANTGQGRRSHPFTGWTSLVTLTNSNMHNHNISEIPTELQLRIIFYLTPNAIRNLIVNRTLRPICEQGLYEKILILKHSERSIRLLETFLARPDLALLVRHLYIDLSWLWRFKQAQVPSPLQPNPLHALSLAKNLKTFAPNGVDDWVWEPAMNAFRDVVFCMKLTRLEILYFREPDTDYHAFTWPGDDMPMDDWDGDLGQQFCKLFQAQPLLEELVLPFSSITGDMVDSLQTSLKASDLPNLKFLQASPYDAPAFLPAARRLERLSVTIGDWNEE